MTLYIFKHTITLLFPITVLYSSILKKHYFRKIPQALIDAEAQISASHKRSRT